MTATAWALVSLSLAAPAPAEAAHNPWLPARVGDTWHYRSGDGKFTVRVAGNEKAGEVPCVRLETVRDGKVVGTELVCFRPDGVVRADVEVRSGDKSVRQIPKPPILLFPTPARKGESFRVDSVVDGRAYKGAFTIGEEQVKVPAGTYKALVIHGNNIEAEGINPTITTWYGEGVGMVKQVIEALGQKVEIELEKFEPAK
jgi:hypothetical protein